MTDVKTMYEESLNATFEMQNVLIAFISTAAKEGLNKTQLMSVSSGMIATLLNNVVYCNIRDDFPMSKKEFIDYFGEIFEETTANMKKIHPNSELKL